MAITNAASVMGTHLRVSKLDAAGKFVTTAGSTFTTKSFISFAFTPEYEEGDEFTQKNAGGNTCVTYKAQDTLKRINLSLAICDPDPELTALISGGTTLKQTTDIVGWAAPKVGEDPTGNGVAIEVWSQAIIDGKLDPTLPYFHWIFPLAKLRLSGERTIQNDILGTEFEGWGIGNTGFGSGPLAPAWAFPTATSSPYAYTRVSAAPATLGSGTATNTP